MDNNLRWEQLRAIEADLLSPPPPDPFQSFEKGWKRAAELTDDEWIKRSCSPDPSPPPPQQEEPSPPRQAVRREEQRTPPRAMAPPRQALAERRAARQLGPLPAARRPHRARAAEAAEPAEARRRPLSPTQLPGVRAIPKDYNRFFRGLLSPGEYFAKSQSRYLGPFETMPTKETLPADDEFIILQRMGRLPDSGKSIFRQVGTLST